jgi:hypothetical protein
LSGFRFWEFWSLMSTIVNNELKLVWTVCVPPWAVNPFLWIVPRYSSSQRWSKIASRHRG